MRHPALRRTLSATCATLLLAAGCTDRDPISPTIEPPAELGLALLAGTPTNLPELPRLLVDTRPIAPTGKTIAVPAGGNLQQAIDQALPGDVITLAAGKTYTGNFILRRKTGTGWITIRTTTADANLPPGIRVTPAKAGLLAKVLSPNGSAAIATEAGAHHYRLIGLEVTAPTSLAMHYGLVRFGSGSQSSSQVPSYLILDRSWVHGHGTMHLKRCVELNSAWSAVIDSYLSACHGKNQDTQAILGWNSPGPLKIENNYLEGAGENVMFGGADPSIAGLIPSDIVMRRNHVYKPPAWRGVWTVKNLLELKNAQRILIEGNLFESTWADAQAFAIVLKSSNQSGSCTWCISQDVTIRHNRVRNAPGGINMLARSSSNVGGPLRRVRISHNIIDNINVGPIYQGAGRMIQILGDVTDLAIDHNTMFSNNGNQLISFDQLPGSVRFTFRNNVANRGLYGVKGSGTAEGVLTLNRYATGWTFPANVIVGAAASIYPTGNFSPSTTGAVGFVNFAGGNYRLTTSSPYLNKATDGMNPGANIDAVDAAVKNVVAGTP